MQQLSCKNAQLMSLLRGLNPKRLEDIRQYATVVAE